jgi:hypothetical protein
MGANTTFIPGTVGWLTHLKLQKLPIELESKTASKTNPHAKMEQVTYSDSLLGAD